MNGIKREEGIIQSIAEALNKFGFAVVRSVLPKGETERFRRILADYVSEKGSPGRRDLLRSIPEVGDLARSSKLMVLVDGAIGPGGFPVRAIFFDKSESANWPVLWHQDLSIAVRQRVEVAGYGPWTEKAGIPHVQPPASVLDGMITLRVHLDDADESNGALMVIPGSHVNGCIPEKEIASIVAGEKTGICRVHSGEVMLMKPLLLHSSKRAENPRHRRVIHIEYANRDVPAPLEWFEHR